jgi:hypothetical protein
MPTPVEIESKFNQFYAVVRHHGMVKWRQRFVAEAVKTVVFTWTVIAVGFAALRLL